MEKFLTFTVIGLTTSAVYAVIASGLVLTYTTTGVFNFAHGALGMVAAFSYWALHVSLGLPAVPSALIVVLAGGPVAGALLGKCRQPVRGRPQRGPG